MNDDDRKDYDDELLAAARRLDTGIAPQRDLWPEIEAAIGTTVETTRTPKRPAWLPTFAQAAAVVLLVGGSSALTYLAVKDANAPVLQFAPELVFEQASFGSSHNLGADYQDARSHLASRLDQELDRLSPAARAEVLENLEVIRQAIGEINAALAQDPNNELLQDLLLKTYREELDVMRQVGGLTQNVMSRNDI